jgi:sugar/nucleoside kinase (ribokinase family)
LFDGGNVKICHFDSRHTEASIIIAKEAIERGIITSIDVEKDRPPHLQSLLPLIDLVITNEKFCDTFFPAIDDDSNNHYPSLTVAIREEGADFGDTTFLDDKLLLKVRKMTKFFEGTTRAKVVISTLGSKGCVLISPMEVFSGQSLCFCPSLPDPDTTALSTLLQDKNKGGVVSTKECILKDTASGRSFHVIECDAFPLHPQDIQDTTGAGDAFIGGLLYAQACQYDFYDSLRLATIVASESLKAKGARASPTYDAVVKILSA